MTTLLDFEDAPRPRSVFESVKHIARTGAPFNSVNLREARPDASGHAIAAILSVLKQKKLIEPYDVNDKVDSRGPNSHGSRPVGWWIATPELLLARE